ncbi:MAG: orotate phosphoribosyltransferase [Elusimicrobia bacterium RIFCSPLOWO2_01_FULL_59_12]|nr:MAG: orotate phosphoribosyltransferase [Elusimicrobia bacterium RIFCSPLOWO2_01_FULL_59_12]
MMSQDEILTLFKERGALLQGHFKLTSGLHSDSYVQCAKLLQYACDADRLGAELARKFKDPSQEKPITAVVSPAIGGIILGYAIARPLGARSLFAERVDGKFAFRRGFALAPGEQVIVAEDVLTTGGSVREIIALVEASGAQVAGIASLADRSEMTLQFPARKEALLRLPLVTYPPDNCPLCEQGLPLAKPGSRPEKELKAPGPRQNPGACSLEPGA